MVELCALYNDIKKQNIYLFPYDVGPEKSVTLEMNQKYAIFADFFRMGSIAEIKKTLAHEIGHCATGCTHKVCSSLDLVQKHEYKANRWAIERYLPFNNLNAAIIDGYSEPWQLAEYFDLPEDFINKAVDYYEISREQKFG
jgi:hypothetical protein